MLTFASRRSRTAVALAAALILVAGSADARPGGGGSFGSRGARTYSAPAPTPTAPSTARPIERSMTQPGPSMQRPGVPPTAQAQPRRFGFGTGLFAGLLGAGLLGMLFGNGFFGGLAGLGSILGLLIQVALLAWLASLAMRWFRRRQEPALAGAPHARSGLGGLFGGLSGGLGGAGRPDPAPAAGSPGRDEIGIGPSDYAAFERALVDIETAYGREDVGSLRRLTTPEMASYFTEELERNAARGLTNKLADPRLLQGDLAEAWREGAADYATVGMRFSVVDATVERNTGRVVEGSLSTPTEAVEIWTFRRDGGGPWRLSAIQQAV